MEGHRYDVKFYMTALVFLIFDVEVVFDIIVEEANDEPVMTAIGDVSVDQDSSLSMTFTATDEEDDGGHGGGNNEIEAEGIRRARAHAAGRHPRTINPTNVTFRGPPGVG